MNIVKIKQKLKNNDNYIKETFYIKEIGIFGSFIHGKQKADSDIDILVEFNKGHKDFFNYIRLKYYLEEIIGHKVDLVIKGAVKSRLKEKILNEVEYV